MDYSLPGFSVHGILQARILDWVAVPFSRGSSQPSNQTRVSCTAGGFFTSLAPRDAPKITQAGLYICVISKRRNNTFKCIENPILNVVSEKGYYGKYWALIWGFFEKEFACSKKHRCTVWEVWQMCTAVKPPSQSRIERYLITLRKYNLPLYNQTFTKIDHYWDLPQVKLVSSVCK